MEETPPFKELVKSLMLSALCYMDQIEQITRVIGYPNVKFISGTSQGQDTQGYIFLEGRTVYVIFRGTENTKDMISDAQAVRLDSISFDANIRLHRGFYSQYKAIDVELSSYLDLNVAEYDEVVFTGHSLGGALATIATVCYYHRNQYPQNAERTQFDKVLKCHTFGCPRVGNSSFSEFYQRCIVSPRNGWRVINENDPAPRFPSQTALFNKDIFVHVVSNTLSITGTTPTSYSVTQTDNGMNVPWDFPSLLSQHHTALYMQRLLQLADPLSIPGPLPNSNSSGLGDVNLAEEITLSTKERDNIDHQWDQTTSDAEMKVETIGESKFEEELIDLVVETVVISTTAVNSDENNKAVVVGGGCVVC